MEPFDTDTAISLAEAEYAKSGVLYDAREVLPALREKYFGTVQNSEA